MELMDAIQARHSIRAFTPEPVPQQAIDLLIAAAAAAPSPHNSQPWLFHVATGATRKRVGEIIAQSTVYLTEYMEMIGPEQSALLEAFYAELGGAPVVIAVSLPTVDDEQLRINDYISAGASVENVLLVASAVGLGTCNITFPHWVRDQLMEAFQVPAGREIVSLIVLGYPAEEPVAPEHRTDVATFLE